MAVVPEWRLDELELYVCALADRAAVELDTVIAVAELTTRVDHKYLVPYDALPDLVTALPPRMAALEIGGRRVFDYESVYFDTDGFSLYRHHLQGRRKRYKARVRTYRDTGDVIFEVKLKGRRGETVKQRLEDDAVCADALTPKQRAFLDTVVDTAYGEPVPDLTARLTTSYGRSTLVDLEQQTRLTIDTELSWWDGQASYQAGHWAMVESKSDGGSTAAGQVLQQLGIRPVRLSKYCVGVALLHPEMAANRWNRQLVRYFGWQRLDRTRVDPGPLVSAQSVKP